MMFDDVYGSKEDKKCVLPPITIINQYVNQPENEVIEIVDDNDENNPVEINVGEIMNNVPIRRNDNNEVINLDGRNDMSNEVRNLRDYNQDSNEVIEVT